MNLEDGRQVHFPRISRGTGYADNVERHSETSSEFYGALLAWNGNGWTLTFRDGRKFYFPDSYYARNCAQGAPTVMEDGQGHRIELKRDKERNLQELISPAGYEIDFTYDSSDRITEAKGHLNEDGLKNVREYSYDQTGHVETVSDATHVLYRFEYAPLIHETGYDPWLLTRVINGDGKVLLENKYFWYRVSEQKLADGELFHYDYRLNGREVVQAIVTLPSGATKVFFFRNRLLIGEN